MQILMGVGNAGFRVRTAQQRMVGYGSNEQQSPAQARQKLGVAYDALIQGRFLEHGDDGAHVCPSLHRSSR